MDKIGIKLADGSFYPILEDGKPEKKNISLTTVKDDQTTVHVDLFRSPSGTMKDAQYIDTLEIDNLNPHTNGEPSLDFNIELGEDGELSAAIDDPETGFQSIRKVNISSLAGNVTEKNPPHDSDLSLKEDELDSRPSIEAGDQSDYEKEMEDIFKAPEEAPADEDRKADSSFEDIVNDISNIGKDADSQEASEVIGPSPNDETFSFDDFDAEKTTKNDEIADEPIEEISAEEALPKDAQFVDSTGDEPVELADGGDSTDTLGTLDAGADQPDFGFSDLADSSENEAGTAELDTEAAGSDETTASANETAMDADGFEELGTLPDWSTGGLDKAEDEGEAFKSLPSFASDDGDGKAEASDDGFAFGSLSALDSPDEDEEKTAANDDNLDQENWELTSYTEGDADVGSIEESQFGDSPIEEPAQEEAAESPTAPESDDELDNLDLPPMNLFEEQAATTEEAGSRSLGETFSEPEAASSTSDDFELPDLDFGDSVTEEADTSFDIPDFDSPSTSYAGGSSSAFDDFDSTLSTTSDWPSIDFDDDGDRAATSSSFTPNNMFDNLYDKETMEGKSSDGYEDEKRSTRVPMLVCIICAVICILCLFFLFVIPTRFNVLRKGSSQEIALNERHSAGRPEGKSSVGGSEAPASTEASGNSSAGELIKPASTASVSAPLPKVESVPAKENEIVIASVPSSVVPETPVKNVKKLPDIQYTVVWGDTLWDIATAYYKNPWKYTDLAEYNHLKNPNFIQTGSVLLIPAE
ncbi:MAG: LysM peptidoglycan-binding domain-containing protein [Treponema sp.]|nr:LysM peptidoglycan-binding domain-containing protein [Treponema sp.]